MAAKTILKVACPSCGQKLDLGELAPFARVDCPSCGREVIAPKPFGTFVLEELLGHGDVLRVYRALDLTLDREVAVKVLAPRSDVISEAFLALARRAAAVNHPGVTPIYSCGCEEGEPFLVTQFMARGTILRHALAAPAPLPEQRQVFEWGRNVAAGLHAARSQHLIHGAVNPNTILLDADGNAKIGDFGLAVLLAGKDVGCSPLTELLPYMSPERLLGGTADEAGDTFGLGVTLYRMFTGKLPVAPASGATDWLDAWRAKPPGSVAAALSSLPLEVAHIIEDMLCLDPAVRPQSFMEISDVLSLACKTKAIRARTPPETRHRGITVQAPLARRLAHAGRQSSGIPRSKRSRLSGLLAALLLLLALVSACTYWLQHRAGLAEPVCTGSEPPAVSAGAPGAPNMALDHGLPVGDRDNPEGNDTRASGSLGALMARYAPNRPRPADLDFAPLHDALARHVDSLPDGLKEAERTRIAYVVGTRAYIIQLMKYVPFNGATEAPIVLRGGERLSGVIPYCNEREVAVRVSGAGELRVFAWGDLALEQQLSFLDYYARHRIEQSPHAGGTHDDGQAREAAIDLLRLAVLCDWYGRDELSRQYAEKAVRYDEALRKTCNTLLPFVLP